MRANETAFVVTIALLWAVITAMGSTGFWFPALFLSVALIALQTILGFAHAGRASVRLIAWVIAPWASLWIIAFTLSKQYAAGQSGLAPPFTILGMHPSFAWIVLFYWLAASVVVCAGFMALSDDWLSAAQWSEFKKRIADMNARRVENSDD